MMPEAWHVFGRRSLIYVSAERNFVRFQAICAVELRCISQTNSRAARMLLRGGSEEVNTNSFAGFGLGLSGISTHETDRGFARTEDFWFIVAVRSEDEADIRAGEGAGRDSRQRHPARPATRRRKARSSAGTSRSRTASCSSITTCRALSRRRLAPLSSTTPTPAL